MNTALSVTLVKLTKTTYRARLHAYLMSKGIPYALAMSINQRLSDTDVKEICHFYNKRINIKGE